MHPLASELNATLSSQHPALFSLLSTKGREAFFPRLGILSQAADADGKDINATIGIALEDDGKPTRLHAIADSIALPPEEIFPYASAFGKKTLRQEWQKELRRKNPSLGSTPISLPVLTAGLTHALSVAAALFLDPGENIHLPSPYWDNYELVFDATYGTKLTTFPLFHGNGFNIVDMKHLLETSQGKQVLFLNFPNNPTGYSPLIREAEEIIDVIVESAKRGNRLVVMSDDAYFGLTFEDDVYPESLFARLASAHENILAIKIDGATKEDFAWGLRVGFLTYGIKGLTPACAGALEEKTAGIVRATVSSGSNVSQSLVLRALLSSDTQREKSVAFELLHERFLKTKTMAERSEYAPFFTPLPCNSGYFLCLKLREGLDAEKVRQTLLRDYSTGVIAIDGLLRIAFSSVPTQYIEQLFTNIYNACKSLSLPN